MKIFRVNLIRNAAVVFRNVYSHILCTCEGLWSDVVQLLCIVLTPSYRTDLRGQDLLNLFLMVCSVVSHVDFGFSTPQCSDLSDFLDLSHLLPEHLNPAPSLVSGCLGPCEQVLSRLIFCDRPRSDSVVSLSSCLAPSSSACRPT